MIGEVNLKFTGELEQFIESRINVSGLYNSADEYIRDLVRHEYAREEEQKWDWLHQQLEPRMKADASEFVDCDVECIIKEAKARRAKA